MRTDNLFHWECPQAPLIVVFPNPLLVDAWNPLSYGYAALLQLCLTGFDGLLSRAESDSKRHFEIRYEQPENVQSFLCCSNFLKSICIESEYAKNGFGPAYLT